MKRFSKLGLLVVVAVLATAAVAASAQAVTINPDNTAVSGEASFPTLDYEGVPIVCDTGTADGTTGTDSDRITNLTLEFFGNCSVAEILAATVDCSGAVTLIAQNDTLFGGTGTVHLNDDFVCVVTTDLCEVTVAGPQTTQDNNVALTESTDVLSADVTVAATNVGSDLCGPPSGDGNFTANYATTPSNLTIDP
jgi:hypothetical protein